MGAGKQMTNEEAFMAWLASKVSPAELYIACQDIKRFLRQGRKSYRSLFDIVDIRTVKSLQLEIKVPFVFRRRQAKSCISAMSYYCSYLQTAMSKQSLTIPKFSVGQKSLKTSPIVQIMRQQPKYGNLPWLTGY